MFQAKITKEEINTLPIACFEGQITLIDDATQVLHAIGELRNYTIVGLDTETRPSFTRGKNHKVALVQISTSTHCFLFRLNKIGLPPELAHFLADKNIKKVGLALRDDFAGLRRQHPFKPENFVDLQTIVNSYGILELGLQKIYAIVFGGKISKSQQLSNWENDELTEQQQRYAATDAWASLEIYLALQKEKKLPQKKVQELLLQTALEQQEKNASNKIQEKVSELSSQTK